MTKYIFLIFLIIFTGCSSKQNVIITKKVYPKVSKDAIFEASKMLFILSNKENNNSDFIIDSYRDKLEITKVIFENKIIKVNLVLEKWLIEVHELDNESRVNLLLIKRDALDLDDTKEIKKTIHTLFWDRLEYLLGLKNTWKSCESYFYLDSEYCMNSLVKNKPDDNYVLKNILISQRDKKVNTIDTVKANIFTQTDLTLEKDNNNIFEQNEEIIDTNILTPIIDETFLETKAEKIVEKKEEKQEEIINSDLTKVTEENKAENSDESISKFKSDMQNIINMKKPLDKINIDKIIKDSNSLKENSEFDLNSENK